MAKRGTPGRTGGAAADRQFNKILSSIPSRAEFKIPMDANSTTEVWDDIDTNLQDGEAWVVYGGQFVFESVDPTVPLLVKLIGDNNWTLQVQRGDDSELLLNFNDDDLMYHWNMLAEEQVSTSGGQSEHEVPGVFRFGWRTVTFREKLRVLFRTQTDDSYISLTTVQLAGYLWYDRIKAPSIGQSKLGQLANL